MVTTPLAARDKVKLYTGMIIFDRGVTCPKHCVMTLENLAAENGNMGRDFLFEMYIFLFYTSQNPDSLICG